jgi:hypothetical protein
MLFRHAEHNKKVCSLVIKSIDAQHGTCEAYTRSKGEEPDGQEMEKIMSGSSKTERVLEHLAGLFDVKYPGQVDLKNRAMELYRTAISRESDFESQITISGQSATLRNLMAKHQDIYLQIKALK